ncbi:MAG TPA: lipid-binding SYLF domain-containing protein [Bryobacteraceae bacterium]|jgi:lipid-binding SYLF domain-containing protein|nr:lipid-binding SYLF domain-containing protein [Bryobacteraceae bacterium]
MKQFTLRTALILSVAAIAAAETAQERLASAAEVFQEVMSTPDKGIPQDLLAKAQCVIIVPGLKKGAFVVGGEFGRGFAECRKSEGFGWGPPAAVRVEGGSVGFQIGGSSTDVVMLVMNRHGMQKLLGDKFTLGADASVAAGPVGRTADASTDARMNAEILAWSRARGVFAGISLKGATLRNDSDTNAELYGHRIDNKEIIGGAVEAPASAEALHAVLDKYSMRK